MNTKETFQLAFTDPPGTNLPGIPVQAFTLPTPYVSWGRPYYESCAKHVQQTFNASRVYVVASGSLARNTDKLDKLIEAILARTT